MSYTPTTWVTGDTITTTKLNKIEQGIAGAGGGVSGLCTDTNGTLDKSYNEIVAIIEQGTIPFYVDDGFLWRVFWYSDDDGYNVSFFSFPESSFDERAYYSSTADGQLVLD